MPALLLIIALMGFVFWPFAIIWALNILFATGIPYSFMSWLAVLIIYSTLAARVNIKHNA